MALTKEQKDQLKSTATKVGKDLGLSLWAKIKIWAADKWAARKSKKTGK